MADTEDRISRLEELAHRQEIWSAAHQAKVTEKWSAQEKLNGKLSKTVDGISSRLSSIERRLIVLCTLASAGGGAAAQWLLKGLF